MEKKVRLELEVREVTMRHFQETYYLSESIIFQTMAGHVGLVNKEEKPFFILGERLSR